MDGDGSTTGASEANQTQTGTSGDGGAGDGAVVATPPADAFAEERNKLNAQIRDFQSDRDRLKAELDKVKAGTSPEPGLTAQPEALTAEGVMALLKRDREMTQAVSQLKSDFPLADTALFSGYETFDSVEAFRAAVESSHNNVKSLVDTQVQPQLTAAVEAALQPYIEKYGRLAAPPAPQGENSQVTGLPTIEEVRTYTADQLQVLVNQHGEDVLERIWRSSTTPLA